MPLFTIESNRQIEMSNCGSDKIDRKWKYDLDECRAFYIICKMRTRFNKLGYKIKLQLYDEYGIKISWNGIKQPYQFDSMGLALIFMDGFRHAVKVNTSLCNECTEHV